MQRGTRGLWKVGFALVVLLLVVSARDARADQPCSDAAKDTLRVIAEDYKDAIAGNATGLKERIARTYRRTGRTNSGAPSSAEPGSGATPNHDNAKAFLDAMAGYWQDVTLTPDLNSAECQLRVANVVRAKIPWRFSGTNRATQRVVNAVPGTTYLYFDAAGQITFEHTSIEAAAEQTLVAAASVMAAGGTTPPIDGGAMQSYGVLHGYITQNGNPVSGKTVTCIDSEGSPYPQSIAATDATGHYQCNDVAAGTVKLKVDSQTSPDCPRPVLDGDTERCDATISGCSNPSVMMSTMFVLVALAPRELGRSRRRRSNSAR